MSIKILIAEDDRHTRRILEHIFTKDQAFTGLDIELLLAPDGEEALHLFEKERPDLVISDLLMPRLDGFALCRQIRKLSFGLDVPLIVTSAIYKETALLNRMREELNVEFFAKPFQVRELVRGVQRLLKHRSSTRVKEPGPPPPPVVSSPRLDRPVSGDLSQVPLASVMFDLLEGQATGVLHLRRGKVKKELYFLLGQPVGAESNARNESFGNYLVVKHILDESQHQKLLDLAQRDNLDLVAALMKLKWLSEEDLLRHLTALVKLRIINCLRLKEGQYQFAPGDDFSDRIPRCTIDSVTLIFLGLKRLTDLDEVASSLSNDLHRPISLLPRADLYRDIFTKVFGDQLFPLLSKNPSLSDLNARGLDPMVTYTQMNALLLSGMAVFMGAREKTALPGVPTEDPLALNQLKQEAIRTRAPSSAGHDQILYQELFGVDEVSVVTTLPTTPSPDPGGQDLLAEIPISVDLSQQRLSSEEARKLLISTYIGIHQKSYYEILGVSRDASFSEIERAFENLEREFDPLRFSELDLGMDHPKLEELNQLFSRAFHVLSVPSERSSYDRMLSSSQKPDGRDPLKAELRFREGEQNLDEKRYEEAVSCFEEALNLDPDVPDYRAHLAWSIHMEGKSSSKVVDGHLNQALSMDPDLLSAHLFKGCIYEQQGDDAQALNHLETALDLDPSHEPSFSMMEKILTRRGEWKVLERLHRKVLHRLGPRFPERTVELWQNLAHVYQQRLADPDGARTCLEIALKLNPSHPEIQRKLKELNAPSPMAWEEGLVELMGRWKAAMENPGPLEDLFELAYDMKLYDACFLCSSVLASLGSTHQQASEFYRRYRAPFLQRARRPCSSGMLEQIRHPDDDPATGEIFQILSRIPDNVDLGLKKEGDLYKPLDLEGQKDFSRVLDYASHQLGLDQPRVVTDDSLSYLDARPDMPINPVLVIHPSFLVEQDRRPLAAGLFQALYFFIEGRAFGACFKSMELKSIIMASMLLVAPRLKISDPDGAIASIRNKLARAPSPVAKQLHQTIRNLTAKKTSLNVGRWQAGLVASKRRLAATMTGDIEAVLQTIASDQRLPALADLVPFLLSAEHLHLRELLGISLAV